MPATPVAPALTASTARYAPAELPTRKIRAGSPVRQVANPHNLATRAAERREQNATPRSPYGRRVVQRRVGPQRPPDDHRRHSDDDASHRVEFALRERKGSRRGQQIGTEERQLIRHEGRNSGSCAEPAPTGQGAGSAPTHQDHGHEQTDRHRGYVSASTG